MYALPSTYYNRKLCCLFIYIFIYFLCSPLDGKLQKVMDFCLIHHCDPECFLSARTDSVLHPRVSLLTIPLLRTSSLSSSPI